MCRKAVQGDSDRPTLGSEFFEVGAAASDRVWPFWEGLRFFGCSQPKPPPRDPPDWMAPQQALVYRGVLLYYPETWGVLFKADPQAQSSVRLERSVAPTAYLTLADTFAAP